MIDFSAYWSIGDSLKWSEYGKKEITRYNKKMTELDVDLKADFDIEGWEVEGHFIPPSHLISRKFIRLTSSVVANKVSFALENTVTSEMGDWLVEFVLKGPLGEVYGSKGKIGYTVVTTANSMSYDEVLNEEDNSTVDAAMAALNSKITEANTTTDNLEDVIQAGEDKKTELETTISDADTKKTELETTITNADTKKSELETTTANADIKKTELEGTISDAENKRLELVAEGNTQVARVIAEGDTQLERIQEPVNGLDARVQNVEDIVTSDTIRVGLYDPNEGLPAIVPEYGNQYWESSASGSLDIPGIGITEVEEYSKLYYMDNSRWEYISARSDLLPKGEGLEAKTARELELEIKEQGEQLQNLNVVNVRDFGATGDGVTDDRHSIKDAITYALTLPNSTVLLPAGTYAIHNGIGVSLPLGYENFTIKGQDAVLKLSGENEFTHFPALRISLERVPVTLDEYAKNVTIEGLTVTDENVEKHSSELEETHGLSLYYIKNGNIRNCVIDNIGDEGIEFDYVIGGSIHNNYLKNACMLEQLGGGGSISIKGGCSEINITDNIITDSSGEGVKGVNIKLITQSEIKNIIVANNIIANMPGPAITINGAGADSHNILIDGNIVDNCGGFFSTIGSFVKHNITVSSNNVTNITSDCIDVSTGGNVYGFSLLNNTFSGIEGRGIVWTGDDITKISGNSWRNINSKFIDDFGIAHNGTIIIDNENVTNTNIVAGNDVITLSGSKGLVLRNTKITGRGTETTGVRGNSGTSIIGCDLDFNESCAIRGIKVLKDTSANGYVASLSSGAVLTNNRIVTVGDPGTHIFVLSDSENCIVSNNFFDIGSRNRWGIRESGSADYNIITNNNTRLAGIGIEVIGANTIYENNIE